MTTNAGAQALALRRAPLGFLPAGQQNTDRALHQALRQVFRPEFLNRVDEIICFQPLTDTEILRIAQLMLNRSLQRLRDQAISVQYTTAALEAVAQFGHDPAYGVRPMRRYLRRELENPAAELLLRVPCAGKHPFCGCGWRTPVPAAHRPPSCPAGSRVIHAAVPKRVPERRFFRGPFASVSYFPAMISSMRSRSSMWCLTPLIS